MKLTYEEQYLMLIRKVLNEGKWIYNERTGVRCLTIPRAVMEYNLVPEDVPLLTTRPSYPVSACAEIIGYIRRYEWANEFADIGSPTWFKNANETKAWLANPNRIGENHLGEVYGAALPEEYIREVLQNLQDGIDNRGLKLDWWQPESFTRACLRPCLSDHQFQIIDETVHLTSVQRSTDLLCGGNFNSLQVYFLGMFGAKISKMKGGTAMHIMNNVHIYEPHLEGVEELLSRTPDLSAKPTFNIASWVSDYTDLMDLEDHAREYINIQGYKGVPQPKIDFELIA